MKFNNNKLSAAVALIISGGFAAASVNVLAQSEPVEEVLVTGIFQSVKTSMEAKRNSDVIADGIASEDLGKFPDQNVAESLQRITGVSIDRDGGEGRSVTVRGFGPEFNAVLYNGRALATEGEGRDFSFDILAADIISGADAYKTNTASILAGGIGATINLSTAKPMDKGGLRTAFTVKGTQDTLADATNPAVSGVVSWSDEVWGVLVSANHQERDYRRDSINTEGWFAMSAFDANGNPSGFNQASANIAVDGDGSVLEDVRFPRTMALETDRGTRTRDSGTAVVQFKPADNLTLSADVLYSKFVVNTNVASTGAWTHDWSLNQGTPEPSGWKSATIDKNQTLTSWEYSPKWDTGWDPQYRVMSTDAVFKKTDRPTETKQFGFNADWDLSDTVKVIYDGSVSSSENTNGGLGRFVIAKDFYANPKSDFSTGDIPSFTYTPSINQLGGDIQSNNLFDIPGMGSHGVYLEGSNNFDDLTQHRVDLQWQADAGLLTKVKGGVYTSSREKGHEEYKNLDGDNASEAFWDHKIDLPDEFFSTISMGDFFDGSYPDMIALDPDKVIGYLNTDAAIDLAGAAGRDAAAIKALRDSFGTSPQGLFTPVKRPGDTWSVNEDINEFYLQGDFAGDLGAMTWTGNLGGRYQETEIETVGYARTVTLLEDRGDNERFYIEYSADAAKAVETNKYSNFLPSANFSLNLTDDQVLRAAVSKTITRPTLNMLNPAISGYDPRKPNPNATAGNPFLSPYESKNLDLSWEYYYDEASYVSLAAFRKDTDNFIITFNELESVYQGAGAPQFRVARPVNNSSVALTGMEFAVQHTFESGFGVQANYTSVDPEKEFDPLSAENSFALEGLSDSANFIAFFERDKLQLRAAYNWRDSYLQRMSGFAGQPETQEAYGQIDLSASYDINDNLSVIFEGINVTGETRRSYSIYQNRLITLEDTGSRYTLGIRGKF